MCCSVVKRSDIWTSKSGPNPLCFEHFDFEMSFAPQRHALFRHPNLQKWSEHLVFFSHVDFEMVFAATTACIFSTSQLPKVVRPWCVLYIFTWKCASRHNGVHFFDISTAKSGPHLVCFVDFHLEMCFAPQKRALFRHRNFQKWSDAEVFCTFWLRNVLRATTACNFSSLIWPYLASWLRTRRFSEPTFRPSGATNHWKNTVFRDFPTFSRICIFFLFTLSLLLFFLLIFLFSLPLPCSAFHLSILSEVWLLNFLRLEGNPHYSTMFRGQTHQLSDGCVLANTAVKSPWNGGFLIYGGTSQSSINGLNMFSYEFPLFFSDPWKKPSSELGVPPWLMETSIWCPFLWVPLPLWLVEGQCSFAKTNVYD